MNEFIIWIADALGVKRKVAAAEHSHSTSEGWLSTIIGGIEAELDGKASVDALQSLENIVQGLEDSKADVDHTHTKSEITDFAHTHTKSQITDFAHSHSIADVIGLQVLLDGLRDDVDNMDGILGQVSVALAGKAALEHLHSIFDVTGLSTRLEDIGTELDGKADTAHTHIISNIVGLQAALAGKSDVINTVEKLELDEETNKVMMGSHIKNGHSYLVSGVSEMAWEDLFSAPSGEYIQTSYQGTEGSKYIIPGSDIIITVFIEMFNNIKIYYISLNSVFGYGK